MAVPSFLFGGNTGETQDTLARKRKIAEALMIKAGGAPKNVGEGLNAVGNALLYRSLLKKIDGGEGALSDSAALDFDPIVSAFGGAYPEKSKDDAKSGGSSSASIPMSDAAGEIVGPSSGDNSELSALLADPAKRSTLPAGMRNNNPGNIKFVGQKVPGIVGPSENTDQGDPQAVFDTPESGMNAMFSLAKRKYDGGKKTPNQLIAGNMGWTPGNTQAAANVARTMGIGPDDDINMNDPVMASKFLRALILQEHGKSGNLYSEDMIRSAIGGRDVSSLDPSIGMPATTAAEAIEQQAPLPAGESLSDEVAAYQQTPEYAARFPGKQANQQVTPNPSVTAALAQPQGGAQNALPVVPQQDTAQQPQVNPQVAQALMAGDQSGVGIGGGAPGEGYFPAQPNQAGQSGPSMQQLMQAAANPNLNDGQRAVVNALLQRKMEADQRASDPSVALDTEYKRAQIDALKAKPQEPWDKLDDRTLYRKSTGETKSISAAGPDGKTPFRFAGSSVEAQSLNGLMDSGALTPEQAQQLGAGKTITGPNGEVIFMTPQGVFGQPAGGGQPQPLSNVPATGGQTQPQAIPQQDANIQITEPKVTLDERKAQTFADRLVTSGDLIDEFGDVGTDKTEVLKSGIPFGLGNMLVGEKFQKFDQARRDFINAQLRRESGAVISPEEFDNANKQYFPQPGDTKEVLQQKANNRRVAIDGMVRDGGPTYKRPSKVKVPAPEGADDEVKTDIPGVTIKRKSN